MRVSRRGSGKALAAAVTPLLATLAGAAPAGPGFAGQPIAARPTAVDPVALRAGHPAITPDQAAAMTPAALGDALLIGEHRPIVAATRLPTGMFPPLPPGSPVLLWVQLVEEAAPDGPEGVCVARAWEIQTIRPGDRSGSAESIAQSDRYRLPTIATATPCSGSADGFFTPLPAERDRAIHVVRLLDAARRSASSAAYPIAVDDQLGREMVAYRRDHPTPGDAPVDIITDPRRALARLPVGSISYVGHNPFGATLLTAAETTRSDGSPRDTWQLFMGGDTTVNLSLEENRIAAMRIRRAIPPPF